MSRAPIVGIIGGTLSGNRGAEAMLVTVIGKIREEFPDAKFKVFTYYPQQDRELATQPYVDILSCKPASLVLRFLPFAVLEWFVSRVGLHLPDGLLTRVIRALRTCDVMVDIAGVSFVGGRELYLPFNILTIWTAMMVGVPVVKLAQALGPFRSAVNRTAGRLFLPHCSRIFARGDVTGRHLSDLGLKNSARAADVAFLYRPEYSLTAENESRNESLEKQLLALKASGATIVALAPSSLVYQNALKAGRDYVQAILELAGHFDRDGIHFLFLANSNREASEKPRNNDLYVLRALHERARTILPDYLYQRMFWAEWDANTRSLRQLLGHCDLLMTSRFHAMIAGLSLGIPSLVIGWSHKYLEALADFGLEKYAADFDDEKISLADLAEELLRDQARVRAQILAGLPHVRKLSEGQFTYLRNLINEK